jgi:hypothetical protein
MPRCLSGHAMALRKRAEFEMDEKQFEVGGRGRE